MPVRIGPITRFYYLELYVRDGFPQAELSRRERKIVRELQRREDQRLPAKQAAEIRSLLTEHGTESYTQLVRSAKITGPLI